MVKFDVLVHERQTQASAVRSASSSCDNASREAFKDEIAFIKRHAETVIFHSDPYLRWWLFIVWYKDGDL
jgi:hypothetical protein